MDSQKGRKKKYEIEREGKRVRMKGRLNNLWSGSNNERKREKERGEELTYTESN